MNPIEKKKPKGNSREFNAVVPEEPCQTTVKTFLSCKAEEIIAGSSFDMRGQLSQVFTLGVFGAKIKFKNGFF